MLPQDDPAVEEVLTILRRQQEQSISTERLAMDLQLTRPRIEQAIESLRRRGYQIKNGRAGYEFTEPERPLSAGDIKEGLPTTAIGQVVHCFDQIDSTNSRAFRLAEKGAAHGTLVVAEVQTKGRGRLQRSWFSPPGLGVWLSVVLRPAIKPADAPSFSLVAGLSLAQTIEEELKLSPKLKWPNDCLLDGKKVAGILTELSTDQGSVRFLILGVGINIHQRENDFPPELRRSAISLAMASKVRPDRLEFLQAFLGRLENDYEKFVREGLTPFIDDYTTRCSLIDCEIDVRMGNRTVSGRVLRINSTGALVLESGGAELVLAAGEVTRVRPR